MIPSYNIALLAVLGPNMPSSGILLVFGFADGVLGLAAELEPLVLPNTASLKRSNSLGFATHGAGQFLPVTS